MIHNNGTNPSPKSPSPGIPGSRKHEQSKDDEYKYKYFVSYSFKSSQGTGFGHHNVKLSRPIKTYEDLTYIENLLKSKSEFEEVAIMNWKEFKEGE